MEMGRLKNLEAELGCKPSPEIKEGRKPDASSQISSGWLMLMIHIQVQTLNVSFIVD